MAAIPLQCLHRFARRGLRWQNSPGAVATGAAAAALLLLLLLLPSRFALTNLPTARATPESAALQMPASPAISWQLPRQLLERSQYSCPARLQYPRGK